MKALVVPTNSPARFAEFLVAWAPWPWDLVIAVQDAPALEIDIPHVLQADAAERLWAYSWAEIDRLMPDPSIISRRDSAIRSFGFWQAWLAGAETIYTLDDDCHPIEDDFVGLHQRNLDATPLWTSSVPGLRVRGLPYLHAGRLGNVVLSMGLWRGVPDLDAVSTLAGVHPHGGDVVAATETRVMPSHQFFPMSGMNLAFRREITSLMYFAPMGEGQPYARFDDTWCGILVQRICRHLEYSITAGRPHVMHRRASDPFRNLIKEAPGVEKNEYLWETIASLEFTATEAAGCMREAGEALAANLDGYLAEWGTRILGWCDLFDEQAVERVLNLRVGR